jgi:RNA polymerase sigma factor (sigma-70 family)
MVDCEAEVHDGPFITRYCELQDESAFEANRRRYYGLVFATCYRETKDVTLAEDATQGVFLLLSQKAKALQGRSSIAGWLFRTSQLVSKNIVRDERRRGEREMLAFQLEPEVPVWDLIEPHLHDALARLKVSDREAVLLRYYQEMSLAEVGRVLGVPENAARMRISRALERMKSYLERLGVVVSVAVLGSLLSERAKGNSPQLPLSTPLSQRAVRAERAVHRRAQLSVGAIFFAAFLAIFALGTFGLFVSNRNSRPQELTSTEQATLFDAMNGTWQGTLQYADDQTRKLQTYPTQVKVSPLPGGGFSWTAGYKGSASVDRTTFTRDSKTGRFHIQNGGPGSSHGLDAQTQLLRLSTGEAAFDGIASRPLSEVRLTIRVTETEAVLQETFRRLQDEQFQFRNEFKLTKVIGP